MILANIHDFVSKPTPNNTRPFHQLIQKLANSKKPNHSIAFFGQPDQKTMDIFKENQFPFLDLDIDFKNPKQKIVPEIYCHIIRDIINNAIHFKNSIQYVVCTTGKDKCDQGRNVRDLLSQMEFQVIDASNFNQIPFRKPIISQSYGPLKKRVIRIMELLYKPLTPQEISSYTQNQCSPSINFHGVPPQDIDLLDLFPHNSHIQGWTRLVEMGIPSRVDLEWNIHNSSAPTVYFSQSFCNKQLMAEYLASYHNGLYVDGHGKVTNSIKAKLEAFIDMKSINPIPQSACQL